MTPIAPKGAPTQWWSPVWSMEEVPPIVVATPGHKFIDA
ncbi:hypothetical protein FHY25_000144 [Xanthomonas arboricola]|nr:hypothetical protein [Xanthomonas campestris]MCW2005563.1 hypothetical protein [Xanthomonas campestris]